MASVWDYVADLVKITKHNEAPISDYMRHLGGPAITDGPGSDNIPVICTAVHLANLRRLGQRQKEFDQLERVERYLKLPWMDKEPGSRNAYSELITEGVECFYASAAFHGDTAISDAAMRWLRATYTATALGSFAASPDGNWAGPYITLCGARCGASRVGEDNGKRWYSDWMPRAPWFMEDHPLSNRLGTLLGLRPHAFVADLYTGYKRLFSVDIQHDIGGPFKAIVRKLVDGHWDVNALEALSSIPGPRIGFTFIRAANGASTVAHSAINYGSTSMLYGLASWDHKPGWPGTKIGARWGTPHQTWLMLDDPRWRQQDREGRMAHVLVEEDDEGILWATGRRQDGVAFDERTYSMREAPHGKRLELPSKAPISWRVVWNRDGAKVYGDDIIIEPPLPPSGKPGWHSIETDNAHLKFTNSMAAASLSIINRGGNHFPVSEVALPPGELAALQRELLKIVGG